MFLGGKKLNCSRWLLILTWHCQSGRVWDFYSLIDSSFYCRLFLDRKLNDKKKTVNRNLIARDPEARDIPLQVVSRHRSIGTFHRIGNKDSESVSVKNAHQILKCISTYFPIILLDMCDITLSNQFESGSFRPISNYQLYSLLITHTSRHTCV